MIFREKLYEVLNEKNDGKNNKDGDRKLSPLQKKYFKYFMDTLDKYGVETPAELDDEEIKKFFNDIKAGWVKGKGPKDEVEK